MVSINTIRERAEQLFPSLTDDLASLVAIPSVSSAADQAPVQRSAEHVRDRFASLGLDVSIRRAACPDGSDGRPAVIGLRHVSDDAPTVLLYAHHDVQPAGDPQRWDTDPFTPTIRDGRMYGRGSADDGAGIVVHLGALSVLGDDLPVNVVVYIEGEEEVGSPSFTAFIDTYRDVLKADRIIVCDADNWRVGEPAVTSTLRGVVSADVTVSVLKTAQHSGAFGGPILDAVTLASRLIATLHDERGDVAVAGLPGVDTADVDYPEDLFRADAGLLDGVELAGTGDIAARLWTKPALAVIGWDQRSLADAANAIAPATTFRLSLRTPPGSDSRACFEALRTHLVEHAPFGAHVEVSLNEAGPSFEAEHTQAVDDLRASLKDAWGVEPVTIGCGGSIPFIADFKAAFPEADVLVTGVEDPNTQAHSENESMHLGDLKAAIIAEAALLARTGAALDA
ncbi:M20/M25/M40 family metallo-hydrolase [Nanchangia anserum]|uniref:M20/M25/M40 family metallo-hydrolase n=1 Tax=Nanchangia anserum TaxID=2692125 RepID=A0A8I0KTQ7_9ACTO|nr:M20/M25/M40 family metallo-hydrolase [Nanchangia anserum]MBD3688853.1 M20/M25/M40 family metallo-hydrolase [Nanchangia anserum]QOX81125.1 M20/M25/M40 family metallo-hydrolase [Nanchangia anserum]